MVSIYNLGMGTWNDKGCTEASSLYSNELLQSFARCFKIYRCAKLPLSIFAGLLWPCTNLQVFEYCASTVYVIKIF